MKKRIVLLALLLPLAAGLSGQVRAYKAAAIPAGNSVAYSLPQTVLKVTVVADKECVKVGPYARYAQKYLGVMAPTVDKELYTIVSGSLDYAFEADPAAVYVLDNPDKLAGRLYNVTPEGLVAATPDAGAPAFFGGRQAPLRRSTPGVEPISYVHSDTEFIKVPVDKRSSVEQSPESMAQQAASTIFSLRKRRMELVTGEFGENVFGAGLSDALREIDRLEQEYTALFLGKQYKVRIVKTFDVAPEAGRPVAIACRFSETGGLLPVTDLSAEPVAVELTPEGKLEDSPWRNQNSKDSRGKVFVRVADMVDCRLVFGNTELDQARIPIYQFGLVAEMPAAAVK